ncbi:hypothetical protein Goari_022855, partial [Gossypium aridum]|nr:hypothetical protein [Gossypium aridum]
MDKYFDALKKILVPSRLSPRKASNSWLIFFDLNLSMNNNHNKLANGYISKFWWSPFWLRIYNIPFELLERQMVLDVGNALGELRRVGSDRGDKVRKASGLLLWLRDNRTFEQDRNIRRNGVELMKSKDQMNADREESQSNSRGESEQMGQKGKE